MKREEKSAITVLDYCNYDHHLDHLPDRPKRGTVAGPLSGFGGAILECCVLAEEKKAAYPAE